MWVETAGLKSVAAVLADSDVYSRALRAFLVLYECMPGIYTLRSTYVSCSMLSEEILGFGALRGLTCEMTDSKTGTASRIRPPVEEAAGVA